MELRRVATGLRVRIALRKDKAGLFYATATLVVALTGGVFCGEAGAEIRPIGAWFGIARPVPGQTICRPGPGCSVPPEIVIGFSVHSDGAFITIDSNIIAGGNHSTGYGQWVRSGPRSIQAAFTLLQSSPTGLLIGGFKNLLEATVVDGDTMEGSMDSYFYAYTDAAGTVITDAEGFPTPSPLAPPSECASTAGCTHLGTFSFKVRRVSVP
jgi:hypothetical protein